MSSSTSVPSPSEEVDRDGPNDKESREEMETRHRKEMKALDGEKRAALKKAKALKGKKGKDAQASVEAEFSEKISKMQERHHTELSAHSDPVDGESKSQSTGEADSTIADTSGACGDEKDPSTDNTGSEDAAALDEEQQQRQRKMEKARRKREKQKEKERRREEEIAAEKAATAGKTPRDLENAQLAQILQPMNLKIRDVPADGNCLYRAVAAQLNLPPSTPNSNKSHSYGHVRALCAQVLEERQDEFAPFVEYCQYNDLKEGDYSSYVERVRSSSDWGGHLELRALAMALHRPIHIYSASSTSAMVITCDDDDNAAPDKKNEDPILLSYHLHYYSLGEHYNQVVPLEKQDDSCQ